MHDKILDFQYILTSIPHELTTSDRQTWATNPFLASPGNKLIYGLRLARTLDESNVRSGIMPANGQGLSVRHRRPVGASMSGGIQVGGGSLKRLFRGLERREDP